VPEGAEPPEAPKCREMIAIDTTQERVAALLMHSPRGVLMFATNCQAGFLVQPIPGGSDEQF
jgi:hypothetical protein